MQWMGRAWVARFTSCLCSLASHETSDKSFNLSRTQLCHSEIPISTSEVSMGRTRWSTEMDLAIPGSWAAPSFGRWSIWQRKEVWIQNRHTSKAKARLEFNYSLSQQISVELGTGYKDEQQTRFLFSLSLGPLVTWVNKTESSVP